MNSKVVYFKKVVHYFHLEVLLYEQKWNNIWFVNTLN